MKTEPDPLKPAAVVDESPNRSPDFSPHLPPRATYIHVPFCAHRCGYCNFTLVADREDLIPAYLHALETELQLLEQPRPVDTLYIGGGTPTWLDVDSLQQLLQIVLHWFPPRRQAEFTVEANPADVTPPRMALLTEAGVTRLSLGAQSFDPTKLRTLERDHTAGDIQRAVQLVRQHGQQIALDLIFAVPSETQSVWQDDLDRAVRSGASHLSTYGLTYEKGTPFWTRRYKGQLRAAAEEDELAMYLTAIDTLTAAGFEHYEISNFARPGCKSRHNEVYWTGGGYYAAGPGAARLVGNLRQSNHRSTTTYIRRLASGDSPVAEAERLSAEELARERLLFGLRRLEGIDEAQFPQQTGFQIDELAGPAVRHYVDQGLLARQDGRLRLTRQGLVVSDSIWPDLL
ncbi:MAG: radical SAM family heme chaperone HemW [Planctomycetales bacterium]|nr:radical SAM family heme chaperone HemW [Planctomycetales bacterium]NIM08916.1 radical SAM family heme chaperone HemW [Planctomycetales bacterium]NIN08386.1 radical SAM family heme chaperone HemW [Planctomycetales bacterium]NIN77514.1 radical SAM family heme chaperone HemW [Planctomycetales bacterium]NIO34686.1 radical SAM family heme chaperone HemW [Planctomycetales bacterium]